MLVCHVKVDHTALILAAQNVHIDIIKCLTEANTNVNMQFKDGRTARILAAQNRHISYAIYPIEMLDQK